jgi:phosphopantothenoylcysteine decarboxylase/phosphopantothenate--cysteine ligase
VERVDVETALDMHAAVFEALPEAGVVVMAAAVADFRPSQAAPRKIKKEDLPEDAGLTLELVRNPDILAEVAALGGGPRPGDRRVVVGFAAESHEVVEAARRKLARKGCDLIVANDVSREGAGFDTDTNAVWFVWPGGDVEELPLQSKRDVAGCLLDRVEKLRGERG